jgi:hypothetical protein
MPITVRGIKQGTSLSGESGVYPVINHSELPEGRYIYALLDKKPNGYYLCINWVY